MTIAREAWALFAVAGGGAVAAYVICDVTCAAPLIAVAVVIPYIFRDPERHVPPAPLGVVSPVDGGATVVGEVDDPFLGRKAIKISIRMPMLGPFVMRSPTEGQVMQQWHLPEGLDPNLLGDVDAAVLAKDPEARKGHYAMWVQTDEQDDVVIVLRGAFISQRLHCGVQVGERIGQGQRCGLIQFAASADVYLPVNSRVEVKQDAVLHAGSDIIATLVHKVLPAAAMVSG